MSNQLPEKAQRAAGRVPLHKVVTRHNAVVFHATAMASFIECAAPLHINAVTGMFALDPETRRWLEEEWWACKADHGRRLRAYVESMWGEFDWGSAYAEFYDENRPRIAQAYLRLSRRETALSLCAAAAQTAAFYRGFSSYADDPELRAILRDAATDEARAFDCFRTLFDRLERPRLAGLVSAYRTVVRSAARARDGSVKLAFAVLARHWYENPPFPEMEYSDFITRVRTQLCRALAPTPAQRLLFRPWFRQRWAPIASLVPAARSDGRAGPAARPLTLAA